MPEPPKITTSLADRIARLNATQKSSDRNHAAQKKEIGEIKSKISKYEATGQYEAPLIPKGSFGLGAPLTKPERGLDRIRIASSGVSGGMTVTNSINSASPGPNPSFRSVSLGRSNRLSRASDDLGTPEHQYVSTPTSTTHPSSSQSPIATPKLNSPASSIINQPTTPEDQQRAQPAQDHPGDSSQVYDGILDGYPTTPAAEDGPPLVTCSNCLKPVDLELLADHLCELSVDHADSNRAEHGPSIDESRDEFPVDVPESPVHEASDPLAEQLESQAKPPPSTTSPPQPLEPSTEIPKVTSETPPKLVIKEEEASETSQTSVGLNKESSKSDKLKNRSSDASSHSTNTTDRLSGSNRPDFRGTSPIYRSWHDDDDDDAYANSDGATGFVTIVRSSSRM